MSRPCALCDLGGVCPHCGHDLLNGHKGFTRNARAAVLAYVLGEQRCCIGACDGELTICEPCKVAAALVDGVRE